MESVWRHDTIELAEDDPPRRDAEAIDRLAGPDHPERIRSDTTAVESNRSTAGRSRSSVSRSDESGDRPLSPTAGFVWTPAVPTVLTLLGLLLGAVYGFDIFDLSAPGRGRLVAYSLLVPYFVAAVNGTLWLFDDAASLRATDAPWQPNPWRYVAVGALALAPVLTWPLLAGGSPSNAASVLGGALLVTFFLSTVVVGPVYLLQRHRRLGVP